MLGTLLNVTELILLLKKVVFGLFVLFFKYTNHQKGN